ncbi:hypothetical protein GF351_00165 [Candidatus Woesearchaeota archaeon]|nr:hypothetical protein [Candidatus Woesearchaeota archaeon]
MAEDISNKTLAILAGIAIVVSVVGLFIRGAPVAITGMAPNTNETGTVLGTVTSNVQVNLTDNTINFGNIQNEEVWNSSTLSDTTSDYLTAKNIGTSSIEVDFWSHYALFYDLLNDTSKHCNSLNDTTSSCRDLSNRSESDDSYQFQVQDISTSGDGCLMDTYESYNNVVVDLDSGASAPQVADSMASGDRFNISIRIDVPKYEESGPVNTSVYVSALEDIDGKDASC